jgi:hypothetical protein
MTVVPGPVSTALRQTYTGMTCVCSTAAKLFVSYPSADTWTARFAGYLELVQQNSTGVPYIQLYDFETLKVIFQHEVYTDFRKNYRQDTSTFATFHGDTCVFGLSFVAREDAKKFREVVDIFLTDKKGGWFDPKAERKKEVILVHSTSRPAGPSAPSAVTGGASGKRAFISDNLRQSPEFQEYVKLKNITPGDLDNPAKGQSILMQYLTWASSPKDAPKPVTPTPPSPPTPPPPAAVGARKRQTVDPAGAKKTLTADPEAPIVFTTGCNPMAIIAERLAARRRFAEELEE